MAETRQDSEIHSPTAWKRDLWAAGWVEESVTIWSDPKGNLWRGPYGAWCELQRRRTSAGRGDNDRKPEGLFSSLTES